MKTNFCTLESLSIPNLYGIISQPRDNSSVIILEAVNTLRIF
jgi:hypothetical protein